MIKTGIVMSIINKKAGIMTSNGEFVYIKTRKSLPKVGEIHTGELCSKNLFLYKYAVTAASLMFLFFSSVYAYAYYTPVTTIVLSSINPSVSLKANRWNRIISSKALNSDGSLILSNVKLKNKSIDSGLELLVKEAKVENLINSKNVADNKTISVDIKSNKNGSIDISKFKNIIDSNKLNIKINNSSDNNKKIDIIVNNKKVIIPKHDSNNNKKGDINKKSIDPIKKPSVENNTKIIKDKTPKIEKDFKNDEKTLKNNDNKSLFNNYKNYNNNNDKNNNDYDNDIIKK